MYFVFELLMSVCRVCWRPFSMCLSCYWSWISSYDKWVIDQGWGQDFWKVIFAYYKLAKKNNMTKPMSSHLERRSLVNKGLIIWLSGKFVLQDLAGNPERARQHNLVRSDQPARRLTCLGRVIIISWQRWGEAQTRAGLAGSRLRLLRLRPGYPPRGEGGTRYIPGWGGAAWPFIP